MSEDHGRFVSQVSLDNMDGINQSSSQKSSCQVAAAKTRWGNKTNSGNCAASDQSVSSFDARGLFSSLDTSAALPGGASSADNLLSAIPSLFDNINVCSNQLGEYMQHFSAASDTDDCSLSLRSNTRDGLKKCPSCYLGFTDIDALCDHVASVHSPEMVHRCHLCAYKTVRKDRLAGHLRIHTGEKPFHCSLCTYKTSDRSNYKKHLFVTHKLSKEQVAIEVSTNYPKQSRGSKIL